MKKLSFVFILILCCCLVGCTSDGIADGLLPNTAIPDTPAITDGGDNAENAPQEKEEPGDPDISDPTETDPIVDPESPSPTEPDPIEEPETPIEPEKPTEEPEKPAPQKTVTYIRVTATQVNVRINGSVVGQMEKGDCLAYLGTEGSWYKTYYKNKEAFISRSYTELFKMNASQSQKAEEVIALGTRFLGTAYVYGATRLHSGKGTLYAGFTSTKFDCSSFMQYLFYYGASVNLGLTTRNQVLQGKYVKATEIKRGDLLFFTNSSRKNYKGIERVGHVALYLGDNYILHTASDYAVIEQISATRWGYYIEARDML